MKRWRGIESISFRLNKRRNRAWVYCVFFTETLVSVKKTQHGKNGFGFVMYGLLCIGLLCLVLGKMQGFGFVVYGLPGEERWLGREGMAKRRAPSA